MLATWLARTALLHMRDTQGEMTTENMLEAFVDVENLNSVFIARCPLYALRKD